MVQVPRSDLKRQQQLSLPTLHWNAMPTPFQPTHIPIGPITYQPSHWSTKKVWEFDWDRQALIQHVSVDVCLMRTTWYSRAKETIKAAATCKPILLFLLIFTRVT